MSIPVHELTHNIWLDANKALSKFGTFERDALYISAKYEDQCIFIEGLIPYKTETYQRVFIYINQENPHLARILNQNVEPKASEAKLFGLPVKSSSNPARTLVFQVGISNQNSSQEYLRTGRWINYLKAIAETADDIDKYLMRNNGQSIDDRNLFKGFRDFDD